MRNAVKHIVKYIALLLLLVCFGHILTTGIQINDSNAPIIYYVSDQNLDYVQHMKENDQELENYLPFTAVGSKENETFLNPDLGKNVTAQLTYIYGNSSLLCTSVGELMDDDLSGCLLSSEAAWQLFGETAVMDGRIRYNDQVYYVRGVYEDENPVVILPAEAVFAKKSDSDDSSDNENIAAFNKIILRQNEEMEPSVWQEYVQAFENRWGLGGDKTDCNIYRRLAAFFVMLIPILIFIYVMYKGIRYIVAHRYQPFWFVMGIAATVILAYIFFMISQIRPSVPVDLIPSRWSDFDFWGDMLTTFGNSIKHILYMDKSDIELAYFRPMTSLVGYTLAGVILFFISNICFRFENRNDFIFVLIGTCITEIIVIYLLKDAELISVSVRMILYMWPYLLIGKYLFTSEKTDIANISERKAEKTVDE